MDIEDKLLTIIIPCFNEESTLELCVSNVITLLREFIHIEVIIVDDCSTDESLLISNRLATQHSQLRLLKHPRNMGKGAAIKTGIAAASGDYIAIQDADLEYNPSDLKKLVSLLHKGADVVFGSRFLSLHERRVLYYWHSVGNKFLTMLSNMFTDLNLTDMETCYKVFRSPIIKSINIEEKAFGVEPELVAKIASKKIKIYETGISYHGRTYAEGKKIGWKDGVRAIYCIFHYNKCKLPTPIKFFMTRGIDFLTILMNFLIFLPLSLRYHSMSAIFIAYSFSMCLHAMLLNYFAPTEFAARHFKVKYISSFFGYFLLLFLTLALSAAFFSVFSSLKMLNLVVFSSVVLSSGIIFKFLRSLAKRFFNRPVREKLI